MARAGGVAPIVSFLPWCRRRYFKITGKITDMNLSRSAAPSVVKTDPPARSPWGPKLLSADTELASLAGIWRAHGWSRGLVPDRALQLPFGPYRAQKVCSSDHWHRLQ